MPKRCGWLLLCFCALLWGCVGERSTTQTLEDTSSGTDTGPERCLLPAGDGVLDANNNCILESCYNGFGDCDDNPRNGCEVGLDTAVNHCGVCGVACGAGEVCESGACVCGTDTGQGGPACTGGDVCCQGACTVPTDPSCACGDQAAGCSVGESCCDDVCEDVLTTNSHCGACGNPCGANQACTDGSCVCDEGTGDCDGNLDNGCEATLATSLLNCGACGNACGAGEACVDGVCGCGGGAACEDGSVCCKDACVTPTDPSCSCGSEPSCSADQLCCNDSCAAIQSDTTNCGACGVACEGSQVCSGGSCTCPDDAPRDCGSGDCVNTLNDAENCGSCGNACATGQSCCGGTCVDTTASNLHCGGCFSAGNGERCSGTEACCDGACTNVSSDANCGSCGNACGGAESCCGNACFDLNSDNSNCGSCANSCEPGWSCSAGKCVCDGLVVVDAKPRVNGQVDPSSLIQITFSCPLDRTSVNSETIRVYSNRRGWIQQMTWSQTTPLVAETDRIPNPYAGEQLYIVVTEGVLSNQGVPATPYVIEYFMDSDNTTPNLNPNNLSVNGSFTKAAAFGNFDIGVRPEGLVGTVNGDIEVWNSGPNFFVSDRISLGGELSAIALGDFNNDNHNDAIVSKVSGPVHYLEHIGSSEPRFNERTLNTLSYRNADVLVGDFNADGAQDFILINQDSPHILFVGDNKGGFKELPLTGMVSSMALAADAGDLNNDGTLDVIFTTDSGFRVALNDGTGSGLKDTGKVYGVSFGQDVVLGDFDGDSNVDIFIAGLRTPSEVWLGDGKGGFTNTSQQLPTEISSVALGDFDNDMLLDAALGSANKDARLFVNDGRGIFKDTELMSIGNSVLFIDVFDASNNGRLDVLPLPTGGEVELFEGK